MYILVEYLLFNIRYLSLVININYIYNLLEFSGLPLYNLNGKPLYIFIYKVLFMKTFSPLYFLHQFS